MICFALVCGREHRFEAWFPDSRAYEEQERRGLLVCPVCGDREVRKAPMAPAIARRREAPARCPQAPAERTAGDPRSAPLGAWMRAMRAVQEHVEKNFENVGERFVEEARRIHEGKAEARGIYGTADPKDVESLREDGVPVYPLPRLPKLDA